MNISVYSLISAIIFFNLGLLFVSIFRRSTTFLIRNSTAVLALLFVLSITRVLLPLDLEHALVINSDIMLPWIIDIFEMQANKYFSVGTVLLAIWGIGTVLVACKTIYVLAREIWCINKYEIIEDERIQGIAAQCLKGEAIVLVSQNVDVPMVMRMRKAYIYMPPLTLTDEEIRLVLLHEFQHVRGKDFFIKIFYMCLRAAFWWNPIVFYFQQEVENLLELRCDSAVTKHMKDNERVTYLEAILNVVKQVALRDVKHLNNTATLVNYRTQVLTKQRFEVILNKTAAFSKRNIIRSAGLIAIAFLCSYFVVIQPAHYPDVDEIEGHVSITKANSYIRIDNNDVIELYVDKELYGILDKKELDVPPYDSLKIIKDEGSHE